MLTESEGSQNMLTESEGSSLDLFDCGFKMGQSVSYASISQLYTT